MWIMNGKRTELINSELIERFVISKKDDAVLIVASYGLNCNNEGKCITLARYQTEEEAYNELQSLNNSLIEDFTAHCMYANTGVYKPELQRERHNGRKHKGHGGS